MFILELLVIATMSNYATLHATLHHLHTRVQRCNDHSHLCRRWNGRCTLRCSRR